MESSLLMTHISDRNQNDKRISVYIDYLDHSQKKLRAEIVGNQFLVWESGNPDGAYLTDHLEYIEADSNGRFWNCSYNPKDRMFTHISQDGKKEKRVSDGIHYLTWDNNGFWCYVPAFCENTQNPVILQKAGNYNEYGKLLEFYRTLDESSDMAADITLTEDEKKVDALIADLYRQAMNGRYVKGLMDSPSENPLYYPPIHPFYEAKQKLSNGGEAYTKLFKLIQEMPKGGNLHLHTSATLSVESLFGLLKQYDGAEGKNQKCWEVYVQQKDIVDNGKILSWKSTLYLTDNHTNRTPLDIYKRFKDLSEEEKKDLASDLCFMDGQKVGKIEYIWDEFNRVFSRISPILKVKEFYEEFYQRAFTEQWNDGIDYIELRCGTPRFQSGAGDVVFGVTPSDDIEEKENPFGVMAEIYKTFREEHDQFKLKLIVSGTRQKSPDDVVNEICKVHDYMSSKENENFIIGYDLVGEEDRGKKTDDYAEAILGSEKASKVPYYFHDGESCWSDNDNVYAAFALGARRIGHGLNLYRFPSMVTQAAEKKVALEVCPISNQLLRYTSDLRMHPLGEFIRRGIPCVVCSDDPLILGNPGLSYDFWAACLGQLLGLKEIKKLILNSYLYSGMNPYEKQGKIEEWKEKWNEFIKTHSQNNGALDQETCAELPTEEIDE